MYILVRICSSSNGHVTSGGYLPLTNGWSVGSINTSGSLRIWTSEPLDPNVGLTNAASPYEGILDVCITSSYWWTAESLQSGSEESVKWSTKVNWLLKRIHHFSSTGGYWKHLVSWNKPGVSFSWIDNSCTCLDSISLLMGCFIQPAKLCCITWSDPAGPRSKVFIWETTKMASWSSVVWTNNTMRASFISCL